MIIIVHQYSTYFYCNVIPASTGISMCDCWCFGYTFELLLLKLLLLVSTSSRIFSVFPLLFFLTVLSTGALRLRTCHLVNVPL